MCFIMTSLPQTLLILILFLITTTHRANGRGIPDCSFEDTVDLTGVKRFANGSYLYREDIIIPADQVGIYDYEYIYNDQHIAREPHPRACLCKDRVCVKFCCHPTRELIWNATTQCRGLRQELEYDPYVNVNFKNGTSVKRNAITGFTVIQGVPCANAYPLLPDMYSNDKWDLYENGYLMRNYDKALIKRTDYCLMAMPDRHGDYTLTALTCPVPNTAATFNRLYNIASIISILFIVAAATIYLMTPELRGLLGKCYISYLISLAIGNIIMTVISIDEEGFANFTCSVMGFTAYFFYESSFLWLNIIGYNLWQNSKNMGRFVDETKDYIKYTAYAFGIPLGFTATLMILQYSEMADYYKPGIGHGVCWLNTSSWSALIYFFGLNALIFAGNIVFYLLTALKEMPLLRKYDEMSRYVEVHMKSVNIYALMLLILGMSWCFNMGSYLEDMVNPDSSHFMRYLGDVMNAMEGPLIFVVLVVRTKALNSLRRRRITSASCGSHNTAYANDNTVS